VRASVVLQFFVALAGYGLTACTVATPRQPPGIPPTPASVTRDEPGGDAEDPRTAAQTRLSGEGWAFRTDRQGRVLVPLADARNWTRVTFWTVDTFAGFRFGDDHHGVSAVFVRESPTPHPDSETCMRDFESWALTRAKMWATETTPAETKTVAWRGQKVVVHSRDASTAWGFRKREYAGVYGAYVPWEGTCLVLSYGFPFGDDPALAKKTRDRFARDAFSRLGVRGTLRPDGVAKSW
jgi:hypothetical protein